MDRINRNEKFPKGGSYSYTKPRESHNASKGKNTDYQYTESFHKDYYISYDDDYSTVERIGKSIGLRNHQNTCYINSVLQVFAHFQTFRDFFKNTNDFLINKLSELIESMVSRDIRKREIDRILREFITSFIAESPFELGKQGDIKLFYLYMINRVIKKCDPSLAYQKKLSIMPIQILKIKNRKPVINDFPILELNFSNEEDLEREINSYLSNDFEDIDIKENRITVSEIICVGFREAATINYPNRIFIIRETRFKIDAFIIRHGYSTSFGHASTVIREKINESEKFIQYNDTISSYYFRESSWDPCRWLPKTFNSSYTRSESIDSCIMIVLKTI